MMLDSLRPGRGPQAQRRPRPPLEGDGVSAHFERLEGVSSPGPDVAVLAHRGASTERLRVEFRNGALTLADQSNLTDVDLIVDLGDRPWHSLFGARLDDNEPHNLGGVRVALPSAPDASVPLPPFDTQPLPHRWIPHADADVATVLLGAPGGNHGIWERYRSGQVIDRGTGDAPWEPELLFISQFPHVLSHQLGDIDLWDLMTVSQFGGREALADLIGGVVADRCHHARQTNAALMRPLAALGYHLAHVEHRKQVSTRAVRFGGA